jgi:predicted aspartyl protease
MRTEIPFRLIGGEQPLIVVAARFNDRETLDCALDTGASHAMLLPEIGTRLGVTIDETREARGAAGSLRVQVGRIDSIAVGEAVGRDVPVLMTDELKRIGAAIGHRLGGNIGYSFLERFRLTVDHERGVVGLATPDEASDPKPARAELPFTLAHPSKPLVLVPVLVDDRPYTFALDTGASTTVIAPEVARRCGVTGASMPSLTGGGGAIAAAAAVIPSLAIGGVRLSQVRVAVAEFLEMLSTATGARIDGIIGFNVLRRFRVTIDYPRKSLRLE